MKNKVTLLDSVRCSMRAAGVPEGSALLDNPDAILNHTLKEEPAVLLLDPDKPEQVHEALAAIAERFGEDGGIYVDGSEVRIDSLDLGGKEYPAIDLDIYDTEGGSLRVDELCEMLDMVAPAAMGGQCIGIARPMDDFALTATFDGQVCEQNACYDLMRTALSAMGHERLAIMDMDVAEEAVEEPVLPAEVQIGDDAYARG